MEHIYCCEVLNSHLHIKDEKIITMTISKVTGGNSSLKFQYFSLQLKKNSTKTSQLENNPGSELSPKGFGLRHIISYIMIYNFLNNQFNCV